MNDRPAAPAIDPQDPGTVRKARTILKAACERGWSIVTAESCTGGLVASLLTDIEGVSSAFDRGFVVYTDEAKCELLDIDHDLVGSCGAVSAETADAMARGALKRSRGDVVIAITGFAGPAGDDDEPGLVHFACRTRAGHQDLREEHFGDIGRDAVRHACLAVVLAMLARALDCDEAA